MDSISTSPVPGITPDPQPYDAFLASKSQLDGDHGFDPAWLPDAMFPHQAALTTWALRKGRGAVLADCGLGKTLIELVWARNVAAETGKPVLIITPLAVTQQIVQEAAKFAIDATRSVAGEIETPIVVTNYERLHLFDAGRFGGVVCDESSILKSFDGIRRAEITEFMRRSPYRLLGTATAAPNDYTELGTSSEALGYLGHMDMLSRFFVNDQRTSKPIRGRFQTDGAWRFKGHAETPFWRWVSSWARAMRRPSDLGFADDGFDLPPLTVNEHVVTATTPPAGMLFDVPAIGFHEEREERRRTIPERCAMAASLVTDTGEPAVVWCDLNDEGDLLERLIPDAVQVSGRDSDDAKEAKFAAFAAGEIRVLITKPKIGAWGLNWQHCNHLTYFPSHSYEQYYQAVRRCWRFGQQRPVTVDIVGTTGSAKIRENLQRKSAQADVMFSELVSYMRDAMTIARFDNYTQKVEVPSWLLAS